LVFGAAHAITAEAFDAIKATLQLGSVAYQAERNAKGEVHIWLEPRVVDKLAALRGPGESYSDVILRLAAGGRVTERVLRGRVGPSAIPPSATVLCFRWRG
jgi:hypothetical protein